MQSDAKTVAKYLTELPQERAIVIKQLRQVINNNIPKGFREEMNYGMIGWVVPHTIYPEGYHCNPKKPLPFMNIASQKNHIALYHMGIYSMPEINNWFIIEYEKLNLGKLDMGKGCIRFKNLQKIPYELIGLLAAKITLEEWINHYKKYINKK